MAKTIDPTGAERPVRMRATRARQGFLDRDILAVLLVSTALAMLVLFAALAIQSSSGGLEQPGPQTRVTDPAVGAQFAPSSSTP